MAERDPCPLCAETLSVRVRDSRPHRLGRARIKVCAHCGHRWKTIEVSYAVAEAIEELTEVVTTLERAADNARTALTAFTSDALREPYEVTNGPRPTLTPEQAAVRKTLRETQLANQTPLERIADLAAEIRAKRFFEGDPL